MFIQQQLMIDLYCHKYLVEQQDNIITIVSLNEVQDWRTKEYKTKYVLNYGQKKVINYESIEEAKKGFFEKTKADYYNRKMSFLEFANMAIEITK